MDAKELAKHIIMTIQIFIERQIYSIMSKDELRTLDHHTEK